MSIALTGAGYRHSSSADIAALQPLDLAVEAREQVAIIGPSGAGKTTLLQILATALRPQGGEVNILDSNPWQISSARRRVLRQQIGFIQQASPLPPRQRVVTAVGSGRLGRKSALTALLNLVYPLDQQGIRESLRQLQIDDKLFQRCDQLSGGQLQRVAIARALYQQPRLILADEPVAAMDPLLAARTLSLLQQEARSRAATLVVSLHAVELALNHFPRIIGLRQGAVLFDTSADNISDRMLHDLYANEQQPGNIAPGVENYRAAINFPCR